MQQPEREDWKPALHRKDNALHRIPRTAGMRRADRDVAVFRTVQTAAVHFRLSAGAGTEPAVPTSCAVAATLRYITARLRFLGAPASIPALLDPIGRAGIFRAYQKHTNNAHELARSGVLTEAGVGPLGTPLYVLSPCAARGANS